MTQLNIYESSAVTNFDAFLLILVDPIFPRYSELPTIFVVFYLVYASIQELTSNL